MILATAAARYTRVATGQTATSIAGGATIRIGGVLCTASSNDTVTLYERDGITVIAVINVLSGTSFELKTGWVADKGLAVTTGANVSCTVFHSQPSA